MTRINYDINTTRGTGRAKAWINLAAGAFLLLVAIAFFASGYTPPGVMGEVVRHNQQADIDASPFFYGDVDNMLELIEGAERLRDRASDKQEINKHKPIPESNQEEMR